MLNNRLIVLIASLGLIIVMLIGFIAYTNWPKPPPPPGSSTALSTAKEQRHAGPSVKITPKKQVKTIPHSVKKPLGLPQKVQDDKSQYVLSTAKLNAEQRPYTLTAVLNDNTGDTTIYARPDPLPWFALRHSGAIGVAHELKQNGQQANRVYIRQDLVQVRQLVLTAGAQLSSDRDNRVTLGVEWRW